jgi:diacylglycerol kinase family enzyme
VTSVEVDGPAPVHAGIDGETVNLSTPLDFEILPSALRVRISARHPGVSPSGLLP